MIGAEYFTTAAPLQALGLSAGPDVVAGMRLSLTHRTAARLEDETARRAECSKHADCLVRRAAARRSCRSTWSAARRMRSRSTSSCSPIASACIFRYLDEFGDPVVIPAPPDCLLQTGFDDADALLPDDNRIFRGFDFLREYFMFPRKFLGFKLTKLDKVMPRLAGKERSTSCSRSTR